uniref:Uncharacterized protein n=1 Tax=Lutzomyia longipalpis TaxID=7200 RepID=A0A7G3B4Z3_LUTLO
MTFSSCRYLRLCMGTVCRSRSGFCVASISSQIACLSNSARFFSKSKSSSIMGSSTGVPKVSFLLLYCLLDFFRSFLKLPLPLPFPFFIIEPPPAISSGFDALRTPKLFSNCCCFVG